MDRSFHILILEERGANTELLTDALQKEGLRFYLHHTATENEFRRQLRAFAPDLIVASHAPPHCDGMAALAAARWKGSALPFILVCAAKDEVIGLEAMRQGATDYVLRERIETLSLAVQRVLRESEECFDAQPPAPGPGELAQARPPETVRPLEKAEEKFREQAQWLDLAPDAILARDMDGTIVYWNKSARRLYGWTAEEALGQKAEQLLQQETDKTVASNKALLETDQWQGELIHVAKNGHKLRVDSRQTLMRDHLGNPKTVLAFNTDITRRK